MPSPSPPHSHHFGAQHADATRAGGAGPSGHVAALDGLRGVAALIVVFRHIFNAVAMPMPLREFALQSPLALLLNAQGAVQLFFVLSGYVLAASLARHGNWIELGQFLIKRVFRIHPPYVFGVLFAWGASFVYPRITAGMGIIETLQNLASVHLSGAQLLESFLFPGTAQLQLPVGWTLRVEMIFSLLLPLLFLLARHTHWLALIALSGLGLMHGASPWIYCIDFALGIVAYLERERIVSAISKAGRGVSLVLVLSSVTLLNLPLLLGWSVRWGEYVTAGFAPDEILIMAIGALGLVVSCLAVPSFATLLSTAPFRFLGRISYSLYLLHGAVLLVAGHLLSGPPALAPALSYAAVGLAISLLLATAAYQWVERPAIAAGNRLCQALARRTGSAAVVSRLEQSRGPSQRTIPPSTQN